MNYLEIKDRIVGVSIFSSPKLEPSHNVIPTSVDWVLDNGVVIRQELNVHNNGCLMDALNFSLTPGILFNDILLEGLKEKIMRMDEADLAPIPAAKPEEGKVE